MNFIKSAGYSLTSFITHKQDLGIVVLLVNFMELLEFIDINDNSLVEARVDVLSLILNASIRDLSVKDLLHARNHLLGSFLVVSNV